MSREVRAWRDQDGTVFNTAQDAIQSDMRIEIERLAKHINFLRSVLPKFESALDETVFITNVSPAMNRISIVHNAIMNLFKELEGTE
jgi:hypothetical protein